MQLILHIFYQMMLYHFNYIPLAQQSINVSSHTYRSILLNEVPKPYDLVVPNDSFPTDIHDEDANYNHLIAGSIVNIFAEGQVYVALSRVNSLDKLRILKFDFPQVKYSKDAIEEYKRLKKINSEG